MTRLAIGLLTVLALAACSNRFDHGGRGGGTDTGADGSTEDDAGTGTDTGGDSDTATDTDGDRNRTTAQSAR